MIKNNFLKDDSCVCVGVYGPVEVRLTKELVDKAYVSVLMRPNVGLSGIKEKSMEYHIRDILDSIILTNLNPRTSINLTIQEIQNNGSVSQVFLIMTYFYIGLCLKFLSCALNACCLALIDANLPLKSMFCAITCALDSQNKSDVIIFPTLKQEKVLLIY